MATNQQYLHELCDKIYIKSIVIKEIDVTLIKITYDQVSACGYKLNGPIWCGVDPHKMLNASY